MRRELCAGALLLLLIAGAAVNLHAADQLIRELDDSLHRAELAARQEDYETARSALEEGRAVWSRHETYVQIFFRHPDLDGIEDAFSGLEQLFLQKDPGWPAALRLLRVRLQTANRMEHPSPGTVF